MSVFSVPSFKLFFKMKGRCQFFQDFEKRDYKEFTPVTQMSTPSHGPGHGVKEYEKEDQQACKGCQSHQRLDNDV